MTKKSLVKIVMLPMTVMKSPVSIVASTFLPGLLLLIEMGTPGL